MSTPRSKGGGDKKSVSEITMLKKELESMMTQNQKRLEYVVIQSELRIVQVLQNLKTDGERQPLQHVPPVPLSTAEVSDAVFEGKVETLALKRTRRSGTQKIREGDLSKVSYQEIREMFQSMPKNSNGSVPIEYVEQSLRELCSDDDRFDRLMDALEIADRGEIGEITEEEMHSALQIKTDNELVTFRDQMEKQKRRPRKTDKCSGQDLLNYLRDRHETAENCLSLPCNILFFLVTLLLVVFHLRIEDTHLQNAAMDNAFGKLKVESAEQFWDWTEDALVPLMFGSSGRIASYNQGVGGILISRDGAAPGSCPISEMQGVYSKHPAPCRSDKVDHSSRWLPLLANGTIQDLHALREAGWVSSITEKVKVSLLTYNAETDFYTLSQLHLNIRPTGRWEAIKEYDSFNAFPYRPLGYSAETLIFLDVVFGVMLLYLLEKELEEMWRNYKTVRNIRESMRRYLGVWNAVDWFNLVVSLVVILFWVVILRYTQSVNDLAKLLPPSDDPRHIDAAKELHKEANFVGVLYRNFRMLMVAFTASIILAFFKSFQANPRLNMVTKTIIVASKDLLHFGIVLSSIFLAFALMGYLIFGLMSPEFSSIGKAIDTTFMLFVGMGDPSKAVAQNKFAGTLWMFFLIIVMQLLLLNMVLAIVFDVYAEVKSGIGDAPSVWCQATEVFKEKREKANQIKELQKAGLASGLDIATRLRQKTGKVTGNVLTPSMHLAKSGLNSIFKVSRVSEGQDLAAVVPVDIEGHPVDRENPDEMAASPGSELFVRRYASEEKTPGMLSEEKILAALEMMSQSDMNFSDMWDADKLVNSIGKNKLSREQASVLLMSAKDNLRRLKQEKDQISLSDCCRLISRVDANVQDLIKTRYETSDERPKWSSKSESKT